MMVAQNSNIAVITTLFFVLVIDAMGFSLTLPILAPLYLDPYHGILPIQTTPELRNIIYGITLSIFFLAVFFGSPFFGELSDQFGRRKVLLQCLLGIAMGFFISAFGIAFKSVTLLIVGRILGGFFVGSQLLAQAAIIDISTNENKAVNLGLITLAGCTGFVIGPLISSISTSQWLLGSISYITPFILAGTLALFNALFIFYFFKETFVPTARKKLNISKALSSLRLAFTSKPLRKYSLGNFIFQMSWGIYFQFIPFYLVHTFQYTSDKLGLFNAFMGILFAFAIIVLVRRVLKKFSIGQPTYLCVGIMSVSSLFLMISKTSTSQWLIVIPFSICAALAYTCFMILFSNHTDKNSQGQVMGIVASINAASFAITGVLLILLSVIGTKIPFIACFILGVMATSIMYLDYKGHKKSV